MITKQHRARLLAGLVVLVAVAVSACFTGPPYGWPGEARESDLPFCDILTREEVAPLLDVDLTWILESPSSNDATGHEGDCEWSVVAPGDDPAFDAQAVFTVSAECVVKETPPILGGPTGAVVEPLPEFADGQAWITSWDANTPDDYPYYPDTRSYDSGTIVMRATNATQCMEVRWGSKASAEGVSAETRSELIGLARLVFDRLPAMREAMDPTRPPTT